MRGPKLEAIQTVRTANFQLWKAHDWIGQCHHRFHNDNHIGSSYVTLSSILKQLLVAKAG